MTTRAVLDTHALAWYLSRPRRLGRAAVRILRAAERDAAEVLVPAIVVVELSLLREGGREVPTFAQVDALLANIPSIRLLPLDLDHAKEFALLEGMTDPFDRMIVATSRAMKVALITADEAIQDSGLVETIWD